MNLRVRDLATIGGLLAAAFVLKLPVFGLPNIEPFTLTYFFIGYRFGAFWGGAVGASGEFLYTTFSPLGASIPPVAAAQIIGMAAAGVVGRIAAHVGIGQARSLPWRLGLLGVAAVVVTLFFDVLTNVVLGLTLGNLRVWLLAGIPFSALHIISNCLLFVFVFPALQIIVPERSERQG